MPRHTSAHRNEHASLNIERTGIAIPTRVELDEAKRKGVTLSSRSILASRAKALEQRAGRNKQPKAPASKPVDAETVMLRVKLKKLQDKIARR